MTKREPPKTLARRGCALWRSTLREAEFSATEMALLEALCAAVDTWGEATDTVKREGVTTPDRFGCARAHPAVVVARDAAATMSRLAKQLDLALDDEVEPKIRHPHAAKTGPRRIA